MNKRFAVAGLFVLACTTATADPVEDYRRACEAPHFEALSVLTHPGDTTTVDWEAAARPCKAFIQRLEAEPEADALTRFALYLAKAWLGDYPDEDERCAEVAEIVGSLPDNADALAIAGSVAEAGALYKGLMAAEHLPCGAGAALERLANRREGEDLGEVETIYLR